MASKSMPPVYFSRPMREGEDQEEYEIGITQNEENLNQNLNYLYNRLMNLENRIGTKEENKDGSDG